MGGNRSNNNNGAGPASDIDYGDLTGDGLLYAQAFVKEIDDMKYYAMVFGGTAIALATVTTGIMLVGRYYSRRRQPVVAVEELY